MSPPFLLVLAVTLLGFSTAAESDLTPVANRHLQQSSSPPFDWQTEMLNAVNRQRAANGLGPLCMNTKLQSAADEHSRDMADHNHMDHDGWNGSHPQDRVKAAGFVAITSGENVASGQQTIPVVMDSWMKSPGHRANILGPNFTMIGCGYDKKKTSFWTQVFASSKTEQCS